MTEPDDNEQRTRLADSVIAAAVYGEALPRQLRDPAAVVKLLDRSLLVYDEIGQPLNVLEALDALLADSPYLIGDPIDAVSTRAVHTAQPIRAMRISSIPNPNDPGRAARHARVERSVTR